MEAIREVGPGGTFLSHAHTFRHFRNELWMPALFERRNWDLWEQSGSLDAFAAAEKQVLAMLAEPAEPMLSPQQEAAIDAVVEEASAGGKNG
jgi:trimethylamine--corrinoid protein Co-methyltransferase